MAFAVNVLISSLVISFCTWLANRFPQLAGFIIALPLSTILVLGLTQIQYGDAEKTFTLAKSILVALMVTLVFFIPFLMAAKLKLGFWQAYVLAIVLAGSTYPLHRYLMRTFFDTVE